ncbi:acyl-coenzyme A oxidase-like protein [Puntigrus tetrazona]|uniref:acyl-coenzyme A oxidase-like protein n=1 Tax=Puntigrus tetrazona TaxID=1606681 RepID=UPI001C89C7A6|nr:acyl-coenzyme A oxidase-like protein [Puntigrus tetrazona]
MTQEQFYWSPLEVSVYAADLLDDALCQGQDLQSNRALQALVAGLKAYSTWENVACLQDCRECTGGMGFMMENRIPSLKCDSDVFVTFEGDNMVMLQLLTQYTKLMGNNFLMGLIRNWTSSVSDSLRTSFLGFSADKVGDLMFLLKAVSYRERLLQRSLASRLYNKFCLLHGTSLVYQERAWYLEHNYLTPNTSRQIRSQLLELCRSVKDEALKVVDDFNIPPCCIQAPIAGVSNPRAEWAFYPQPQYPGSTQPKSKL